MSIPQLLDELAQVGAELHVVGSSLKLRSRSGMVSSELKEKIHHRKDEITHYLMRNRSAEPALSARPRSHAQPLSFAQERLWLLDQLGPVGPAYNIPAAVRLRGQLDVGALERAFATLIERHEVLRAHFEEVDGKPVQVTEEPGRFRMGIEDLSELPELVQNRTVRERTVSAAEQPFDLARGPLFRVSLLKLSTTEHVVLVGIHHIISDGWSTGVLIREVGALYAAFVRGRPSPLPALPVQYADYAIWQREWLQGEVLDRQLNYWRDRLHGAPAALDLPTDRPRPAVQSYRGSVHGFALSRKLTADLVELSQREGATLFMVLLAAFQVVLSRWSGQTDIVVGTPIAGRSRSELEGLIGFFVNTLALRTELGEGESFKELLGRIKETTLGAFAHQDLPFEKLVEMLQPPRDLSRQPVFQVLFTLQNVPRETLHLPGLTLRQRGGEQTTAKLDLSVYLEETDQGLRGVIEYAADLFDAATIERLAGHLRVMLEGIAADPDGRISELPLIGAAERDLLLDEWNDTTADYPKDKCLHELFAEQVVRTPDAVAAVFEGEQISYEELDCRSNQLAHHLRELGVGPDTVVGLCVERSLQMVVGLLGILKAGGAYLPLDPDYPAERLAYMVADSGSKLMLTGGTAASALPTAPGLCLLRLDADAEAITRHPATALIGTGVSSQSLAYVLYTSGSTGKPKGVMIRHDAVVNFLCAMGSEPGIASSDVLAAITPLSFDIAGLEVYLALLNGARICILSRTVALDGAQLKAQLNDVGATILQATPSTWQMLLDEGWKPDAGLKMLCGGEAMPADLKSVLSQGSAWNLYGPTETTIWSTMTRLTGADRPTIGRPISNTRVYVLDRDRRPVPIGVPGELYIGGDGLARGYRSRPGLTAERFTPSPYGDGERLYRTGDLAQWRKNGELEYLGRIDHQVKLRGYRIELGEIETALLTRPDVRQAVVVLREDTPGDKRLVAYVTAAHARTADAGELREHLKQSFPEYMVPSAYVTLEALPLTPSGKVDRWALPAPEGDGAVRDQYVSARTPAEEVLVSIWAEVLKLDRVGVQDNFFGLGGHSLLAMRLVARIRNVFRIELSLRTLFEAPTIAQLALAVEDLVIQELEEAE
jgi:amino acid adenylation domain-containing protein